MTQLDYFIQRNAPKVIRRALRGVMAKPIRVAAAIPQGWSVDDGPVVTVSSDGSPRSDRATSTENVRVNVYGKFEPEVRRVASEINAWLLNPHSVGGFRISPGPFLIVKDEDVKGWVAAVTVVAASTKKGLS